MDTVSAGSLGDISATSSPLLIRRNGERWRSPITHAYSDEEMLKHLLRDSPQLLPTYADGMVVVDELSVPLIGFVDLTAVDSSGSITLVECKLGSNPEIRRSVVGQIFAYAAGLWQMSYDDFDRAFSSRKNGISILEALRIALPADHNADWEEHCRQNIVDNLANGRFTLVIAVDQITDELKRVVPYINLHTSLDLQFLALGVEYIRDGDVELVRPLTYGRESVAEKSDTRQRRVWGAEAYLARLCEYDAPIQNAMNELVAYSLEHGGQLQGGSGALPSLNVQFSFGDKKKTVGARIYTLAGLRSI